MIGNNECHRMWKELVVVRSKRHSSIFMEEVRNLTGICENSRSLERDSSLHFSNTNQNIFNCLRNIKSVLPRSGHLQVSEFIYYVRKIKSTLGIGRDTNIWNYFRTKTVPNIPAAFHLHLMSFEKREWTKEKKMVSHNLYVCKILSHRVRRNIRCKSWTM
jgi:hypothetical protein